MRRFYGHLCASAGRPVRKCVILYADHLTSKWYHDALDGLDQMIFCIIRGRLQFYGPNRRTRPAKGSVVIGFGVSQQRFAEAFGPLGIVTTPSPLR